MKKMILFAATLMLPVAMMTSCLGNTGNKVSGNAVGVLEMSAKSFSPVLISSAGTFAAPEINAKIANSEMNYGSSYIFEFELDYDLPENSSTMVAANGYMVVSLLGVQELPESSLHHSLTDTTTVLTGEIAIKDALYSNPIYVDNHLFLYHVANHQDDLKVNWELSYDYSNMTPVEEGGYRIYELYLRAVESSSSSKVSLVDNLHLISYNMGSYLEDIAYREKAAFGSNYNQNSAFKLRFNYPSEIKDGVITWKYKNTEALPIYQLLPAE